MNKENIIIAVEGALGDCAKNRHQKALEKLSGTGAFTPIYVDIVDQGELADSSYINKNDTRNVKKYTELKERADYVIISSPNEFHVPIAIDYIQHNPNITVITEKPLAHDTKDAELLLQLDKDFHKRIFLIDHYLLKQYELIKNGQINIPRITTDMIVMNILENRHVEPSRVETLEKGMIFDLFSHALLNSVNVISSDISSELDRIKIKDVTKFRYEDAPIENETSSIINLIWENKGKIAEINIALGKGVGATEENKRLYTSGYMIDYKKNIIYNGTEQIGSIDSDPHLTLYKKILAGEVNNAGLLDIKTAAKVLELTEKAFNRTDMIQVIPFATSLEEMIYRSKNK